MPPVTFTVAVPLLLNGQVASVVEVESISAQGAEQLAAGWKPIAALLSVPFVR